MFKNFYMISMQIWLNVTAAFVLIKSFPMDSSFLIAFFSWIDTLLKIEFMIASKNTFQVTYIFSGPVSIYSRLPGSSDETS